MDVFVCLILFKERMPMSKTNVLKKLTHDRNFTIIDNKLIQNPNLSMKAKGLACYLLSLPDDWTIIQSELQNHFTDGDSSVRAAMKELREAKYLLTVSSRDAKGRIIGWRTYIRESLDLPWPLADKEAWYPDVESPDVDFPHLENQQLLSTNNTKDLENKGHILCEQQKSKNEHGEIFEQMWNAYPLKKGKQTAYKAFLKAIHAKAPKDRERFIKEICGGLKAHIDEHRAGMVLKKQGADIWVPQLPHLSTWLNKGRWEDGYQSPEDILKAATRKNGSLNLEAIESQWKNH